MVKRSPFPVYFALIPRVVIHMEGLGEVLGATQGSAPRFIGILWVWI